MMLLFSLMYVPLSRFKLRASMKKKKLKMPQTFPRRITSTKTKQYLLQIGLSLLLELLLLSRLYVIPECIGTILFGLIVIIMSLIVIINSNTDTISNFLKK